jgi:hypothetical protein
MKPSKRLGDLTGEGRTRKFQSLIHSSARTRERFRLAQLEPADEALIAGTEAGAALNPVTPRPSNSGASTGPAILAADPRPDAMFLPASVVILIKRTTAGWVGS